MEEPHAHPQPGDDRSTQAAERLRALRERVALALHGHRRRISDIEGELNQRVQQITDALAHDEAANEVEHAAFEQQRESLEAMQQSLAQRENETAALLKQVETLRSHAEHGTEEQLTALEVERTSLAEQLQSSTAECTSLGEELASVRDELRQFDARFQQESASRIRAEEDGDRLRNELASIVEHNRSIQQERDELRGLAEERKRQCQEAAAAQAELQKQFDALAQEQIALQQQLLEAKKKQGEAAQLAEELAAARAALEALRTEDCPDCSRVREELSAVEQKTQAAHESIQSLELSLAELKTERDAVQSQFETAQKKNEQATALLGDAESRILALTSDQEERGEMKEFQRKFELALADVHKLKKENAGLREELVRRPEADEQETEELISLRTERDELAARIGELESSPPACSDEETQQQLDDLHRRFEMAVDDLRELKQENAELTKRLENASHAGAAPSQEGPLDWQAQKARLLAELDAEESSGVVAPNRIEARATIEGTISITDQVVADKDREIAELRELLESKPPAEPTETVLEAAKREALEEVFSQDELIQSERARMQQINAELNDKLRQAELEISVERAKLAREKAELEDKLSQLAADARALGPTEEGKPRRRWLSALGIKEEEKE